MPDNYRDNVPNIEEPEVVLESMDIRPDRIGTIAAVVQALATVAIAIILAVQL